MKFIVSALIGAILMAMVFSLEEDKHAIEPSTQAVKNKLLGKLTCTVNSLVSASTDEWTPSTTRYLWDYLPMGIRFLALNQSQIQSKWNVTEQILLNATKLEWISLSNSVKAILLSQQINCTFLSLTFSHLGWSSSTDQFAYTTLFSFLSSDFVAILSDVAQIVNHVSLDTILDSTKIKTNSIQAIYEFTSLGFLFAENSGKLHKQYTHEHADIPEQHDSNSKTSATVSTSTKLPEITASQVAYAAIERAEQFCAVHLPFEHNFKI